METLYALALVGVTGFCFCRIIANAVDAWDWFGRRKPYWYRKWKCDQRASREVRDILSEPTGE